MTAVDNDPRIQTQSRKSIRYGCVCATPSHAFCFVPGGKIQLNPGSPTLIKSANPLLSRIVKEQNNLQRSPLGSNNEG